MNRGETIGAGRTRPWADRGCGAAAAVEFSADAAVTADPAIYAYRTLQPIIHVIMCSLD